MTTEEFQAEAQRIRPRLLAIARRYIDTSDEAEDIVQDGLLRLWQMLDELRLPIDSFAATVVRNLAIDHRRRHGHTSPSPPRRPTKERPLVRKPSTA